MKYLFRKLIGALADWLFETFPNQRRAICIAFLVAGFGLATPLLIHIWTGHGQETDAPYLPVMRIGMIAGVLLILIGAALLTALNRRGRENERI